MKDIFEQLILDFHASDIPKPSLREFKLPYTPRNVRKAYVFIGMRRSGKTWSMYQIMNSLIDKGTDKKQILYLNFEDDRLLSLQTKDLQDILNAYFELYPQYIKSNDLHFFFDEIHEVKGWERFIRRLLDQENMNIYITGSSAKMLGADIASALRGRTFVQEIFPFNFREYLCSKNIPFSNRLTSKHKAVLGHYSKEFLKYGGFPEALFIEEQFHRNLLQGYIDVVIYRDIVERYHISNVEILRELIIFCLQNSSSSISLNKIYHRFKSLGRTVGKNSLYDFMKYLEDAYCIFTVPLYTTSLNKQNINPKKIYSIDQGFITAYTIKPDFEDASRLENAVFCSLRSKTKEIFYYKTKTGKEVDFIILLQTGIKELYQVCVSISEDKTKNREISALIEAMDELDIKKGIIITLDNKEIIKHGKKTIECIPVYEWFLY